MNPTLADLQKEYSTLAGTAPSFTAGHDLHGNAIVYVYHPDSQTWVNLLSEIPFSKEDIAKAFPTELQTWATNNATAWSDLTLKAWHLWGINVQSSKLNRRNNEFEALCLQFHQDCEKQNARAKRILDASKLLK